MSETNAIVFADPERYRNARFVPIATRTVNLVSVYNAGAITIVERAEIRAERATGTRGRRAAPEGQDLGQDEAGGKFHSLLGLRKIQLFNPSFSLRRLKQLSQASQAVSSSKGRRERKLSYRQARQTTAEEAKQGKRSERKESELEFDFDCSIHTYHVIPVFNHDHEYVPANAYNVRVCVCVCVCVCVRARRERAKILQQVRKRASARLRE